jgi:hypothetical protein
MNIKKKSDFFKRKNSLENWLQIILKGKVEILNGAQRNIGCKNKFSCLLLNSPNLESTENQFLLTFRNCFLCSSYWALWAYEEF